MARRLIDGTQNDGTIGLRATLPGFHADEGDGQGGQFTFNSAWTDIAKIHQIGLMTYAGSISFEPTEVSGIVSGSGYKAVFPDPGYYPFVEMRKVVGGTTVYDDHCCSGQVAGFGSAAGVRRSYLYMATSSLPAGWDNSWNILYVVYRVPIPVPVA